MLRQSHAPVAAARRHPEQRHVLLIEDDFPIRAMVTDVLEDAGYAVLQAPDGFEAVRLLRGSQPDLIVLDLMLPGMSG